MRVHLRRVAFLLFSTVAASLLPPPATAANKTKEVVWAEPEEDMALVYLIRTGRFQGKARTMFVYADDRLLGVLDNKTYTYAYLEPGRYLFWLNWSRVNRDIELGPNTVTYVNCWDKLYVVGEDEGKELINKVGVYATPLEKEIATSKKHLASRSDKAIRRAKKQGRTELEQVEAPAAPADTEGLVRLAKYTEVNLELMENVTTHLTPPDQKIWFRVINDVKNDDGRVVLGAGSAVAGTLRRAAGAKGFGVGGAINVVIPVLTLHDGTQVPTVGQVTEEGRARPGAATAAWVGGGILGAFAVKGREAFHLAGETCRVWTTEEAWVAPVDDATPAAEVEPGGPGAIERLTAHGGATVEFAPHRRKSPNDVLVSIASPRKVAEVAIYEVDGWKLPEPVPAGEIAEGEDGWTCSFDGWQTTRFLRPTDMMTDVPVVLRGEFEDGSPFVADAKVRLQLRGQQ